MNLNERLEEALRCETPMDTDRIPPMVDPESSHLVLSRETRLSPVFLYWMSDVVFLVLGERGEGI